VKKIRIQDQPKNCIRTNSGLYINVFNTKPEMICIEDIAHSLATLPRFGGHLNRHYSVAQHSVLCARRARSKEDKRAALLHDASEAFMLDMPTPIKARLGLYKRFEHKLSEAILKKFGVVYPYSKNIKKIDTRMLHIEWDNLAINDNKGFECWTKARGKREFLKMYKELFT